MSCEARALSRAQLLLLLCFGEGCAVLVGDGWVSASEDIGIEGLDIFFRVGLRMDGLS